MKTLTEKMARTLAHDVFQTSPFDAFGGYNAKSTAQKNLDGKTHYVDDNTLRFFHSRINATYATDHGALFTLIESVATDMHNTSRGFRFVVFDLAGNVVRRGRIDHTFRTSKQATAAMWEFLNEFDVVEHYRGALAEKVERDARILSATRKAKRGLGK